VGTNDINLKIPNSYIIRNYERIIEAVKKGSPHTQIIVQSVFPINNQLIGRQYYKGTNEEIQQLNQQIRRMAAAQKLRYVDVYTDLLDAKKEGMDARFTYDGLHLSGLGYERWVQVLKREKLL
jgi:lysophospholipase L1-like esterase